MLDGSLLRLLRRPCKFKSSLGCVVAVRCNLLTLGVNSVGTDGTKETEYSMVPFGRVSGTVLVGADKGDGEKVQRVVVVNSSSCTSTLGPGIRVWKPLLGSRLLGRGAPFGLGVDASETWEQGTSTLFFPVRVMGKPGVSG